MQKDHAETELLSDEFTLFLKIQSVTWTIVNKSICHKTNTTYTVSHLVYTYDWDIILAT